MRNPLAVLFYSLVTFACGNAFADDGRVLRFDRDIRPILSDKCLHCHGPDPKHREADLRLDQEESAKESSIVESDPDESELIRRILTTDPDEIMPPLDSAKILSQSEKDALVQWVASGAKWSRHWAFVPPEVSEPAAQSESSLNDASKSWGTNRIDDFVLKRLNEVGLSPNDEADQTTLLRRVTLDLTGLPPTLVDIENYLSDHSDNAFEKVVDRLLASDQYGERMAVMWLDAARYGDTSVYHADGPRDMWAWRDAIVTAYNDDMPFDEFSTYQLAGDLVADATVQQKVLAGFNRNNGTTDEGGAIAEEYRVEYAVDRVKTTATTWLGLSMECGQCHDHKYDPITQEEYYQFYAFFNVSADGGMQTRKGNAEPILNIPDPEKLAELPKARVRLQDATQKLDKCKESAEPAFASWLSKNSGEGADRSKFEPDVLFGLPITTGKGKKVAIEGLDSSGTIQGKAQWMESPFDKSLKFDGSNYIDLGDIGNFERTDSFSYGGWFKSVSGVGAAIARMDDGNKYRGYDLYVGASPISMHIINSWPENAIKVTTKESLKADTWHHVLATYDGSSKAEGIHIYVDGQEWEWKIEQDGLSDTIRTEKTLLVGSRHPGSRYKGEIDLVHFFDRCLTKEDAQALARSNPIGDLLAISEEKRTKEQTQSLRNFFLNKEDAEYQTTSKKIASIKGEIAELEKPLTTVMVMGNQESLRDTFILNRGAYDSPTDTLVKAGVPSVLPPLPEGAPENRLGLAKWLFSDEHPLTARVAVNRYWLMLFGTGLVSTPEDFGSQGEFPSHPELLDWLAVDFQRNGWSIKRTIKQIVMSSTYRQSSKASKRYVDDPENRLLSRGARFRLQGEFVRDSALATSGLLNPKIGGPGVKPYQPPGLWAEVGLGGNPKFKQDHGDALYRRSLYTYWKRSAPPPSMQIFDAPTREKCTIRRPRTNTPLQALVTLNDPQFVEASRHFARRILAEDLKSDDDRIGFAYRAAIARLPTQSETQTLLLVLNNAKSEYKASPDQAEQLLSVGESARDESLNTTEHAAWTIVAATLLNLDETLTRE